MTDEVHDLRGFSNSVREVVARAGSRPTVWMLADAMLRHDSELRVSPVLPLADRDGEHQTGAWWLKRARALFDVDGVLASTVSVINVRLTLLALARLHDEFGAVMRSSGLGLRIERDLGVELGSVLWPWALPAKVSTFVELRRLDGGVPVHACGLARDASLAATVDREGNARVWDLDTGEVRQEVSVGTGAVSCGISPEGMTLLIAGLRAATTWEALGYDGVTRRFEGLDNTVRRCIFGTSGSLFAVVRTDGTAEVRDLVGMQRAVPSNGVPVRGCVLGPDESTLATIGADGAARVWNVASLEEERALAPRERGGATIPLTCCAFNPDGRLLAVGTGDGETFLWDGTCDWIVARGGDEAIRDCSFSLDGRSLATMTMDGTVRVHDVASGREIAVLDASNREPALPLGRVRPSDEPRLSAETPTCGYVGDGRLVASDRRSGILTVFDEVEAGMPLAAIAPDTIGDVDLVGVGADAEALANVIAAVATAPPLSIGLFGDWGSGKSFLIKQIQERVRHLSQRSRDADGSVYCNHVRNVEFNAWHYADASLWASLVTHIFDELAKPDATCGVFDEKTARAQVARLEEQLAANATLQQRLEQAQRRAERLAARKQLLRWTWRLVGADEGSLSQVDRNVDTIKGSLRLLLPGGLPRALVLLVTLLVVTIVSAIVAVVGVGSVIALAGGVVAAAGAALSGLRVTRGRVRQLVQKAGDGVQVADVRDAGLEGQLAAAVHVERELRREFDDLQSGRRLARFVSEGSGLAGYRTQLGLVSQIHDDFAEMSRILRRQSASANTAGDLVVDDKLPQIDRIVLYIDDLDRCPPRRVVEVLEAVHLILAVELFVVVLAVDPRWLLQSLQLHYSELLAAPDDGKPADESAWHSTPLHYLEKIIQMPFALRPMGNAAVRSLVHGLLPVVQAVDVSVPPASGDGHVTAVPGPAGARRAGRENVMAVDNPIRQRPSATRRPSMSPQQLALTMPERDFAVRVACALPTPRAVKKFTNMYRLLRAGLDDASGQLERFLTDDGVDAPEYSAVLTMLVVIIAFPEEASDALLALRDFGPDDSADARPWRQYVDELRSRDTRFAGLTSFLDTVTPDGNAPVSWTCGPFRRWVLEVSRFSFATGQEVFARSIASVEPAPAPVVHYGAWRPSA